MKLKNSLQIGIVFLICFIVLEIIARIFLYYHLNFDVEMSRYAMSLKEDSPDWHIGHVHTPNAQARLMGVMVQTNSDGFRGRDYPVSRSAKKRLMFLGNSITLGWGVEEKDIFSSLLESKLDRTAPTEIINTASGNYNTEMETYLFLEKGLKYRPDKVVLFYSIRDAIPTQHKSKLWFLGYSELVTLYWSCLHNLKVASEPTQNYKQFYSSLYKKGSPGLSAALKAFILLRDTCKKNGITLQVVLLPDLHQLVNYPFTREDRIIMDFLRSNGIDALDLAPYFSNYHAPMDLWVARDDPHPNKEGHRLIAQYVFDFIKKGLY